MARNRSFFLSFFLSFFEVRLLEEERDVYSVERWIYEIKGKEREIERKRGVVSP
jgi:hypothetical protein